MPVLKLSGSDLERITRLETEVDALKLSSQDHRTDIKAVSDKIDRLSYKLLAGTACLGGLILGSKMLTPEALAAIKGLF